ncbi:MAG: pyruvate kinase [Phycisphaerae bacterium]|jgi:pyruvate kinase|nr:pyruvate kinase [Phycisphaerae bacterium]
MITRTKIVATLGPATSEIGVIRGLAEAGADVFRINFSHGDNEGRKALLDNIRAVEADMQQPLCIMGDLCGPKIRVREITGGSVLLGEGQEIVIQRADILGTARRISTTLEELAQQVEAGQTMLLDDGKIRLEIIEVTSGDEVRCRVTQGGMLAGSKGVNLPGTQLKISAITEKDRTDITWIATQDFDYVALSFVQVADDVIELRQLLDAAGCGARIVAKIERPQAIENIEAIIDVADAVMVARGDLGVEMDLPSVPVAQKRIARLCRLKGKPCIIATQMLESMTALPTPTRAEVSDVANAVQDLADAVMLSGETAVGEHPSAAVKMMDRIAAEMQLYHDGKHELGPVKGLEAPETLASLARAVHAIADAQEIAAIAAFTITGSTARVLSKQRPQCPILGISPELAVVRQMCLYYGVQSMQAGLVEHTTDVLELAAKFAVDRGVAEPGDNIIVISGRPLGKTGVTNTLVVHTIE